MRQCSASELLIDGSYGEGGGQIVRTAVSLSAISERPVRIENIRAGRPKPGLAAQHLTSISAAGALCDAVIDGATLGSQSIGFRPTCRPRPGDYRFDVSEAREGGSAGASSLVLLTVAMPLAFAGGPSRLHILGGTHNEWSPTFDYIRDIWIPFIHRIGIEMDAAIQSFGFYPAGGGEIDVHVSGAGLKATEPFDLIDRGPLLSVTGRAIAANLPPHIPQRMADHARALLKDVAPFIEIDVQCVQARCPGAALFLAAHYQHARAGFSSLGRRGKPSEAVADEAVNALLFHKMSGAAFDRHLADQALVPLAVTGEQSIFTCEATTNHLRTNAWVIEQFGLAKVVFEEMAGRGIRVQLVPLTSRASAPRTNRAHKA